MTKIYGPYTRKDGRQHVIVIEDDGARRTISYPKWLVEQELGRKLDPNLETVDHLDRDFNNNDPSNLAIKPRPQHASDDALRTKLVEITCDWCGNKALKPLRKLKHNSKAGKRGKFCGKACAGAYSRALQLGRVEELPIRDFSEYQQEYYRSKDLI